MITIMRSADQRLHYVFHVNLVPQLSGMPEDERESAIDQLVSSWVSENEGYNSLDYDRMVEAISDDLSYQVLMYLEMQGLATTEYAMAIRDRDDDWATTDVKHIWYSAMREMYTFSNETGRLYCAVYPTQSEAIQALAIYAEQLG